MSLQRGINLRSLAEKMGQCSGAEVRGICTEAGKPTLHTLGKSPEFNVAIGMYALRERRQHVTQEDFEFAVAKVRYSSFQLSVMLLTGAHQLIQVLKKNQEGNTSVNKLFN